MRRIAGILAVALALSLGSALPTGAEQQKCAECGMRVDPSSRFSAMYEKGDRTLHFCDIGDLLVHLAAKKLDPAFGRVKDFSTGAPVSASAAWYVIDLKQFKTPMHWGIAAFQSRDIAQKHGTTLTFGEVMEKVK